MADKDSNGTLNIGGEPAGGSLQPEADQAVNLEIVAPAAGSAAAASVAAASVAAETAVQTSGSPAKLPHSANRQPHSAAGHPHHLVNSQSQLHTGQRLPSIDVLRGGAVMLLLFGSLVRPADYIPHQLKAGGPFGFTCVDLAAALLLFIIGFISVFSCRGGHPVFRIRRPAILLLLAFLFSGFVVNHLIPTGDFFLAAAAASVTASAAVIRPVRQRSLLLIAVAALHFAAMPRLTDPLSRTADLAARSIKDAPAITAAPAITDAPALVSVILGALTLTLAGSIVGSIRLNGTFRRFIADSAVLALILIGFAAVYYFSPSSGFDPWLLNPVILAPGFCLAAAGISIALILLAAILIDRLNIPIVFSVLAGAGKNSFTFWLVPIVLHLGFFTRFSVATPAGPILIRDRMFYNVMDMWSQPGANILYPTLLIIIGYLAATAVAETKLRFRP